MLRQDSSSHWCEIPSRRRAFVNGKGCLSLAIDKTLHDYIRFYPMACRSCTIRLWQ
jgi:hypothetical protein